MKKIIKLKTLEQLERELKPLCSEWTVDQRGHIIMKIDNVQCGIAPEMKKCFGGYLSIETEISNNYYNEGKLYKSYRGKDGWWWNEIWFDSSYSEEFFKEEEFTI